MTYPTNPRYTLRQTMNGWGVYQQIASDLTRAEAEAFNPGADMKVELPELNSEYEHVLAQLQYHVMRVPRAVDGLPEQGKRTIVATFPTFEAATEHALSLGVVELHGQWNFGTDGFADLCYIARNLEFSKEKWE